MSGKVGSTKLENCVAAVFADIGVAPAIENPTMTNQIKAISKLYRQRHKIKNSSEAQELILNPHPLRSMWSHRHVSHLLEL